MATISTRNGRRIIQWADATRKRRTLSLGQINQKGAALIRDHIERLIVSRANNQTPPMETVQWLAGIGPKLHAKLAAHKLVEPRGNQITELEPFIDRYIAARADMKERSRSILGQVKRYLVEHFGPTQAIQHINRGDAKDYRAFLVTQLSPATVSMHVMRARQIFGDAVDRRLVSENPFDKLVAGPQTNESRRIYIPRDVVQKVIDACPSIDWKLMFALARFGGLRTPSESFRLTWPDILWDQKRMIVHSPKTEHHEGKDKRIVPIEADLMPYLEQAFNAAPEGSLYVIANYRSTNPSTHAKRLIAAAGVTPWVKTFQNLRASCQTDWCDVLPVLAVCAMIGNTEVIAQKHYVSVKDEHFEIITGKSAAKSAALSSQTGAKMTAEECENLDKTAENLLAYYPRQDSNLWPSV